MANKRKKPLPATAKTLEVCRELGWLAGKVEIPGSKMNGFRSHDLFGFVDIAVVQPQSNGMLLIQATAGGNGMARVDKLLGQCEAEVTMALEALNRVEVWSWERYSPRGTKRVFLDAIRHRIVLEGGVLRARAGKTARELLGKVPGKAAK